MPSIFADIPELDAKGLRRFAVQLGLIVAGLFGLLLPWILNVNFPRWPWIIGGALVAWALLAPATLRPLHRFWMGLAMVLHRIMSPLILGIVFYLVVSPLGLFMRLFRADPMRRKRESQTPSYRVQSQPIPKDNLKRPF
jgi:hypothetical protein